MGLGAFTKELAKQAIGDQVKDVVDSLRPPDLAVVAEEIAGSKPALSAQDAGVGAILISQLQAMQNALKDSQELLVMCSAGVETLRVLEVFVPAWRVAVLTGIDTQRTITRIISPFDLLQLVCKPVSIEPGAQPVRIRFITPKA